MDPFFSRLVLGPRLGGFIDKHPDLQLELITRDQLGDMVADGFDLAIRFGEPPVSTLIARKLLDTRILTVAAPSYLKKHGHPVNPAELESGKHVCIKFRDPLTGIRSRGSFIAAARSMVVTPQGRLTVNDVGTLHSACAAGQGIAQILSLGAESLLANGKLVELFPDWGDEVYPLYALYPSRHHPPAKVRAFYDFIVSLTGGTSARSGGLKRARGAAGCSGLQPTRAIATQLLRCCRAALANRIAILRAGNIHATREHQYLLAMAVERRQYRRFIGARVRTQIRQHRIVDCKGDFACIVVAPEVHAMVISVVAATRVREVERHVVLRQLSISFWTLR